MIRLLLASLLLTSSLNPGFALTNVFIATGGSAVPALLACPQGTGVPADGCANAPAPLTAQFRQATGFQPGDYLNTVAGTPANYMNNNCGPSGTAGCRQPFNVPGIDYAIGNYTPAVSICTPSGGIYDGTCLLDPAANPPAGCTYAAPSTVGGSLTCGSGFAGVLQHYNFGPVNGHGCTYINLTGAIPASSLLIDDIYFFNDSGICAFLNDNGIWLNVSKVFSGGVVFSSAYLDFNSGLWDTTVGGCSGTSSCNPNKIGLGSNTVVEKYIVIRNSSGNPLTSSLGSTNTQLIQYSWIENWCSRGPNCHAEAFDGIAGSAVGTLSGAQLGGLTFDYTTFLQGQTISTFGPTSLWMASAYPMAILSGPNITNSMIINSYAGGRPKAGVTFSGCVGATYSGGCSGAGNTLFVTSETSPVGYGAALNCGSNALLTYKKIIASYPSGVVDEYVTDGFFANQYGPSFVQPSSPFNCTSVSVGSAIAGNSAITATHAATPFGSPNYSGNYVDVSSYNGSPGAQQIWQIATADAIVSVPSGTITTSLGVSTLNTSGVTAEFGAYVNGTGVDGCSTNVQSCPRIASGSAGVYTLDRAVTAIGPIAMTINPINWCAVPAVLTGNVDMTAQMPLSWLNQLSAVTAGNGC